eukprot:3453554-Pyramimonas_sp.AAC.1
MAVAVIVRGWPSAVSLFQHLHRRLGIGDGANIRRFPESSEGRRDRLLRERRGDPRGHRRGVP